MLANVSCCLSSPSCAVSSDELRSLLRKNTQLDIGGGKGQSQM